MTTPAEAIREEWAALRAKVPGVQVMGAPQLLLKGYIVELKKSDLEKLDLLHYPNQTPEVITGVVHYLFDGDKKFDVVYMSKDGVAIVTKVLPTTIPYVVLDPPPPKPVLQVQPAPAKLDPPKPQREDTGRGYGYEPTQW